MWPETLVMISRLMREYLLSPRGFTSEDLSAHGFPPSYVAVLSKRGWIKRFGTPEYVVGAGVGQKRYIQRWVFTSHAPAEVEKMIVEMKPKYPDVFNGKI